MWSADPDDFRLERAWWTRATARYAVLVLIKLVGVFSILLIVRLAVSESIRRIPACLMKQIAHYVALGRIRLVLEWSMRRTAHCVAKENIKQEPG